MLAYGLFISLAAILEACSTPARVRALGARDGACGQALNKPEGRKPRSAPTQWESSGLWRLMGQDVPRCCGMLEQAGC